MARQHWVASLIVLVGLAGCLQPDAAVQESASPDDTPAADGLLAHPRILLVPAGSSEHVFWLNATAEDWVEVDGESWLWITMQQPKDADMEGFVLSWYRVLDGGKLDYVGGQMGSGGSGGNGDTGAPHPESFIGAISYVGVSSPFELRLGAGEGMLDFDLQGHPVPVDLLATAADARAAGYIEFGSALVPFGEPFVFGDAVKDSRTMLGGQMAALSGKLSLTFDYPVEQEGMTTFHASANVATGGARAGTWAFKLALDEEEFVLGDAYTPASYPFLVARSALREGVTGTFQLDAAADLLPVTVLLLQTVEVDLASRGLSMDPEVENYGAAPILLTARGCWQPGDLELTPAACRARP